MPWNRPKPRTYEYNYQIQSSYYKPVIDSLDKKSDRAPRSYAEDTSEALAIARERLAELEKIELPTRTPLWKKHPYYMPIESERTSPHEGSVWPESRPHFHLVSSYDCMVGYLGLKEKAREELAKETA